MSLVLIVDDEADIRLNLRVLLEIEGYEVKEASTGEEALEAIAARRPDLVLLDLRMPVMNGLEVLEHLRSDPRKAGLPVAILSAFSTPGVVDQAKKLGADTFMTKPFDHDSLLKTVAKLTPGGDASRS